MTTYRKCWDDEKRKWLIEHKGMNRTECYGLFCKTFNVSDISFCAFNNERSRIGAVNFNCKHPSTKQRPLYSEHKKKGYTWIKVAQPNVWMLKSRWVWEQANNKKLPENYIVVFLDLNNENFAPENLYAVDKRLIPVCNQLYKLVANEPEENLVRFKQAELHMAVIKTCKDNGMCYSNGAIKHKVLEQKKDLIKKNPDKYREYRKQWQKRKIERLKQNPEAYAEYKRKTNEYKKLWARKKKQKMLGLEPK